MSDIEYALPALCYGDPAETLDQLRVMHAKAKRQAANARKHKSRRIQALVKEAMRNGGGHHGK